MSAATASTPRVSGRTDPEVSCAPATDPAGFIYPSYRAAATDPQETCVPSNGHIRM
jgi:hypothetical protein